MGEGTDEGDGAGGPPSRVPWPPIILVAMIALSLALGAALPLPVPQGLAEVLSVAGLVLVAAALAVDFWALVTLSRARTTVMPNQASDALVTSGPFARSRNPIYAANAALLVGLGFALANPWFLPAAAALVVLTTRLAIRREERHLAARFGDAYRDYRARVPRWL